LWTFLRYRLFWAVYRDVIRDHLRNPHCACQEDLRMTRRARRLRSALESLGPTFIKLGQFLSRRPDILPPAYLEVLSGLQEDTPAVDFLATRRRLEEVCICGRGANRHESEPTCLHCHGIDQVFIQFERKPVASASLAQVHRAIYRGRQVAVKFLKPGVLDRVNADLSLLRSLHRLIGHAFRVSRNIPTRNLIDEFGRRLQEELNFEYEALNIERFRENHPGTGPVLTPAVYWEFKRTDLLVLEFVEGVSLRNWQGPPKDRRRLARTLAQDFIRQVFIDNFFHADPHPGNLFVQSDGRIVYLDFGAVGQLDRPARRAVLRLFHAVCENDPDLAVAAVLQMGQTEPQSIDLPELRIEVDRIIRLYRQRRGARWTDSIVQTARRHGIRVPRSILMYARAAMLNEIMVTELDPEFEVMAVARQMVLPIVEKELLDLAGEIKHQLPEVTRACTEIGRDLPRLVQQWLQRQAATPQEMTSRNFSNT